MEILPNDGTHPLNHEAFEDWREWRKTEKKKPITQRAAKMQQKFLQAYPDGVQRSIIDHSIMNDYQGLFELRKPLQATTGRTRDRSIEQDLLDTSWAT